MADVSYPAAVLEMQEIQKEARVLGLDVINLEIRQLKDIAPAVKSIATRADALYICADALISSNQPGINTLALAHHLPTVSGVREYAKKTV